MKDESLDLRAAVDHLRGSGVESPEAATAIAEGADVTVDLQKGTVSVDGGTAVAVPPLPPFMQAIIRQGGWMAYLQKSHLKKTYGPEGARGA